MLGFLKKKQINNLKAYISGDAIRIEEVNDGVFSEKILGEGMAIIPSEELLISPCDGTICSIADTKHAVGLQLNNGIQLLLHIGLDTVSMNGDGFTVYVKEGQSVKEGQKLISFDRTLIKKAGFADTVIMVVVENENDKSVNFHYGEVLHGESVIVEF